MRMDTLSRFFPIGEALYLPEYPVFMRMFVPVGFDVK